MPEGPSIVILKEKLQPFAGKEVLAATGNTKIDLDRINRKKVNWFKSWGKHLLIGFDDFTIRIHLLMFGSYSINETAKAKVRLGLEFKNGFVNFHACNVKIIEGDINKVYDWGVDIMSDQWNLRKVKSKLKKAPDEMICDALLDQDLFAGVGNIIKNEALYLSKIHPESMVSKIPSLKITELLHKTRDYSFDFLEQKKAETLSKNWLAYAQKKCSRCDLPFKKEDKGSKKRGSYFCDNCQKLYV